MINRRKFIEAGAAAGVGAMLPLKLGHAAEAMRRSGLAGAAAAALPVVPGVSPLLTKYVDALPLPGAYTQCVNPATGALEYYVAATAFTHRFHRDLPPTPVWGYQPSDPAGTVPANPVLYSHAIIAQVGQGFNVNYLNKLLPTDIHPLEFEPTQRGVTIDRLNVDGMLDAAGVPWPDQRIAVHLHGGRVEWMNDGGPRTWFTGPFFSPTAPYGPGSSVLNGGYNVGSTYFYPNTQPATLLWFHDHAMGITRYNVLAGLAAPYLLADPREANLFTVPAGQMIPLVIQDRIFNASGTFWHPPAPLVPEFFGDTMLVNGKAWPYATVGAGQYRLRILNGCNARFLRMQFVVSPGGVLPSVRNWVTLPFTQIGAEGGLFGAPAAPATQLLLAPAERADIIVDFSSLAATGGQVILYNDAATPFSGTADTRGAIPEIMIFNVQPGGGLAPITLPASFAPLGGFVDETGGGTEVITQAEITAALATPAACIPKLLTEITLPNGLLAQLITSEGGTGFEMDPVTKIPTPPDVVKFGSMQIWQIINNTVDTHPIHTHQAMFRIVGRYKFGMSQYLSKIAGKKIKAVDPMPFVKGALIPPGIDEAGWKDTVRANPGELTLIAVKWLPVTSADMTRSNHFVYHCHILEHEEHDMMRNIDLVP